MLHTSFEVVVSLKVIFYPNGFLEKKNYAKTRPGSDFSTMSYRKGERNAMCQGQYVVSDNRCPAFHDFELK